ncbi:hypothetical protein CR513_51050, partial [Mucuna pruriens]
MFETKLLDFDHLKELYLKDEETMEVSTFMKDFSLRIKNCVQRVVGEKAHEGGLIGNFGE